MLTKLPLEIISDFQECDFGEWDGLKYEEIKNNDPQGFASFISNPSQHMPKGVESLIDFHDRIRRAVVNLLEKYNSKKVLIVTHGGVIRCLVSWCLNMDKESSVPFQNISIDYASLTTINVYHGEPLFPQLKSMNVSYQENATSGQS